MAPAGPAAVQSLDLDVARGELLTLLGPSGSGKTTTLMMLAGFETPSAGRILLDGRDIARLPPHRRGIGMVFQSYALFPHMTVAENVAFPLQVRGVSRHDQAQARWRRRWRWCGWTGCADRRPAQLSGGQQQRVALARALVFEPPIVLLDEPLGALDKALREEMQLEIRHLHQRLGVTMMYVTHDQAEALTLSDRIAVFEGGRRAPGGRPARLYDRPADAFVAGFVGENNLLPGTIEARDGRRLHACACACGPVVEAQAVDCGGAGRGLPGRDAARNASRWRASRPRTSARARCRRCCRGDLPRRPCAAAAVAGRWRGDPGQAPGRDRRPARTGRAGGDRLAGGRGLRVSRAGRALIRRAGAGAAQPATRTVHGWRAGCPTVPVCKSVNRDAVIRPWPIAPGRYVLGSPPRRETGRRPTCSAAPSSRARWPPAPCRRAAHAQGRDLTVVSWGGAYQDAQREVFFRPFQQATRTRMLEETWDGGIGVLRSRIASGANTWDVVQVESEELLIGADEGLFEPHGLGRDRRPRRLYPRGGERFRRRRHPVFLHHRL